MFKSQRYLTRGVSANIPPPLQVFIWNCIELLPDDCDYLQGRRDICTDTAGQVALGFEHD